VTLTPPRRRRRAVGPAGATPSPPVVGPPVSWLEALPDEQPSDEQQPDEDDRLLREVPPHHGGP